MNPTHKKGYCDFLGNLPRTAKAVSCKRKLANENSTASASKSKNVNMH